MNDKEKLYETMGELIFAVAKADGVIHDSEMTALQEILDNHHWAKNISWSFNYERDKNTDPNAAYKKVVSFCHSYGPTAEYAEFIDVMQKIAEASGTVEPEQANIINSFSHDLTERFRKDVESKLN
jgi:uncharacterized tellurite resistance protein B-like protein